MKIFSSLIFLLFAITVYSQKAKDYYDKYWDTDGEQNRIDLCTKCIETPGDSFYISSCYRRRAENLMKLDDLINFKKAIEDIDNAIAYYPGYEENYFVKGDFYYDVGMHFKAFQIFNNAVSLFPDNPSFYMERASKLEEISVYPLAIKDITTSIQKLDETYADIYLPGFLKRRAKLYSGILEYDKALVDCDKIITLYNNKEKKRGDVYSAYLTKVDIYIFQENYINAIKETEKAFEYADDDYQKSSLNTYLGWLQKKKKNYELSEEYFIKNLQFTDKPLNVNHRIAFMYYAAGNDDKKYYKKAIEYFNKTIEENPKYLSYYYYRGTSYYKIKSKKAKNDLNKYIAEGKDQGLIAYANYDLGNMAQALEVLQKEIQTATEKNNKKDLYTAYYNLACIYGRDKNKAKCLEYFELAIKNDFTDGSHAKTDSDLEIIRNEPRFIELIKQLEQYNSIAEKYDYPKYKKCIQENPDFILKDKLTRVYDGQTYYNSIATSNINDLNFYLKEFPNGIKAKAIKLIIESIEQEKLNALKKQDEDYQKAISDNTIEVYNSFLKKYPNSKYKSVVQQKIDGLIAINMKRDYENAIKENTIASFNAFIQKYPPNEYTNKISESKKVLIKQLLQNSPLAKQELITLSKTNLYGAPNITSNIIQNIYAGEKISDYKKQGNFYQINYKGKQGYISILTASSAQKSYPYLKLNTFGNSFKSCGYCKNCNYYQRFDRQSIFGNANLEYIKVDLDNMLASFEGDYHSSYVITAQRCISEKKDFTEIWDLVSGVCYGSVKVNKVFNPDRTFYPESKSFITSKSEFNSFKNSLPYKEEFKINDDLIIQVTKTEPVYRKDMYDDYSRFITVRPFYFTEVELIKKNRRITYLLNKLSTDISKELTTLTQKVTPKGEFEPTKDYETRLKQIVSDYNALVDKYSETLIELEGENDQAIIDIVDVNQGIEQKRAKNRFEIIKNSLEKDISMSIEKISDYNADKQQFKITFAGNTRILQIPLSKAQSFKANYKQARVIANRILKPSFNSFRDNQYTYFDIRVKNPVDGSIHYFSPRGKIYFDKDWSICDESNHQYFRTIEKEGEYWRIKDHYKNGQLQMTTLALSPACTIMMGDRTNYHENGKVFYSYEYKYDLLWNIVEKNSADGKKLDHGTISDGSGSVFDYYENGTKSGEYTLLNGLQNGIKKRYYDNGQLAYERQYNCGLKHGYFKRYSKEGKLRIHENLDFGYTHGDKIKYNEDGTIKEKVSYKYGWKQ